MNYIVSHCLQKRRLMIIFSHTTFCEKLIYFIKFFWINLLIKDKHASRITQNVLTKSRNEHMHLKNTPWAIMTP